MNDLIIRPAVPADAIAPAAFAARTFSDTFAADNQPAAIRRLHGAFHSSRLSTLSFAFGFALHIKLKEIVHDHD